MKKNKKSGALIFFNALLVLQYLPLLYLILAEFKFIPWYASDASFILYYLLWLPLCITSILSVIVGFFTGSSKRADTMLICYNALVIPLLFLSDIVASAALGYIVSVISIFTIVVFVVRYFRPIISRK